MRTVLHVGCGQRDPARLHATFRGAGWKEIRLDIDPAVKPDIIASITHMRSVPDGSIDAVWSSHNLEHLYAHEVPLALREFRRVLKAQGLALITLPDLQQVARLIAADKLDEPVYVSPAGPVAPLDMLYGHRSLLSTGQVFMAHRTGFTRKTLGHALVSAGFEFVRMWTDRTMSLWASAHKNPSAETISKARADEAAQLAARQAAHSAAGKKPKSQQVVKRESSRKAPATKREQPSKRRR
jgi:predicted SAM-dependent methyltransferase